MQKIHYLGPVGTFTEQAAKMFQNYLPNDYELVPRRTLQDAINFAANDGLAVVPYYNLYEGLIQETLDCVTEYQLTIIAAQRVPVCFAIGGITFEPPVFSHQKALAQCSDYLKNKLPGSEQTETSSTSEAAKQVAKTKSGLAIARREALEQNGLTVFADDIGNRQYGRANYTEFLLIGREKLLFAADNQPNRTMVAVIPSVDRVGLLAEILGQVAFFGINLLKIHSRPALSDHSTPNAPQMFYLEMQTKTESKEFQLCRATLDLRLTLGNQTNKADGVVQLLGDYPLFTM
jgi:prephenate dehydratase